ncbi:hypothetical protein R80B4_01062 [Fibrobacteres bacterium R8-0-B4]
MPDISDVLITDVTRLFKHRDTKHCVCVSVSNNKFLVINSNHRDKYDDFEIKSADYAFLNSMNRLVCCSETYTFNNAEIIKKVGNLNRNDMVKIVEKIINSKILSDMEKNTVLPELNKWAADN